MNPEYQSLCVLAAIAAWSTVAGASVEGEPRVLNWISLISLAVLRGTAGLAYTGRPSF